MINEVMDNYEIDGLFLDCWAWDRACYGNECIAAICDQGIDVFDHAAVVSHQNEMKIQFIRRIIQRLGQK